MSPRGWPDTALCVPPILWVIEAKREVGRFKPEQIVWGEALKQCTRVEYRVARPSNVQDIVDEINAMRRG